MIELLKVLKLISEVVRCFGHCCCRLVSLKKTSRHCRLRWSLVFLRQVALTSCVVGSQSLSSRLSRFRWRGKLAANRTRSRVSEACKLPGKAGIRVEFRRERLSICWMPDVLTSVTLNGNINGASVFPMVCAGRDTAARTGSGKPGAKAWPHTGLTDRAGTSEGCLGGHRGA